MKKVITYGTFDLLHYGHIRLLERAKKLGDYLIVGITSDDYDKTRGKINNRQSLMERILAVKETGLADEIIIEEFEGQKIDDIKKYGVDIFTVGSDWVGKFDYLKEYCEVVYLDRTQGVSSSELRSDSHQVRIKPVGSKETVDLFKEEAKAVNGIIVDEDNYDSVYLVSSPDKHFEEICDFLKQGKNVLCQSPLALKSAECKNLFDLAKKHNVLLMDGIKTAYATAFQRLLLFVKSKKIGDVVSIEATCTSLDKKWQNSSWNSICAWGPIAILPVFELLGTKYKDMKIVSHFIDEKKKIDGFTKIDFIYEDAVASIKIGKAAKSEGQLIITGTKGYIIVPSPWWKTDYFEIRYENPNENKRFFYQLDGNGLRYEIVSFVNGVFSKHHSIVDENVSVAISSVIEEFYKGNYTKI